MENPNQSETKICSLVVSSSNQEETGEVKTTDQNESLQSSSVLLTPDASPVKEKDSVSESAHCSDEEPNPSVPSAGRMSPVEVDHTYAHIESKLTTSDSESSTHCKQLQQSPERTPLSAAAASPTVVPKKRKGRQGKAKSGATDKAETQPRPKSGRRKKIEPDPQNKTITDYFPVRRSGRRTETSIKKDQIEVLEQKILNHSEDGLKVVEFEEKGRGVIATRLFNKGEFVVEYAGELVDLEAAKEKEQFYSENPKIGCYMYYFIHKNKRYCVDATAESGKLGRLINHSRNGNCNPKVVEIKKLPYLILVASREINEGEELLYDYGDRSKSSLESHPWLKL